MQFGFPSVRPLILALSFSLMGCLAYGQIAAPGHSWAGITHYLGNIPQDSIFVFAASPSQPNVGKLSAHFSDESTSTFQWYRYNSSPNIPIDERFQLFATETAVENSQLENLQPGGYRVVATRLGDNEQETYTTWIFEDRVVVNSIYADNQCEFLYLEVATEPDRYTIKNDLFNYYDLSRPTHPPLSELGDLYFENIEWSTSNPLVTIPPASGLSISISNPAPLYDATYRVEIASLFGREFSFETPTIIAKAIQDEWLVEVKDPEDEWVPFDKGKEYEALFEFRIGITIAADVRIDSLFFYVSRRSDDENAPPMERIWADSSAHTPSNSSTSFALYPKKELFVPGEYVLKHRAISLSSGCSFGDSIPSDGSFIKVAESELKIEGIPNVFSPNGDGQNDFFLIKEPEENLKSIATFSITIHNRWGARIYSYTGDPRTWKGWDGKSQPLNLDAPEGVYFYVIEAVGWDGKKFRGGPYKGFLHLFRGN